MTLRSAAASRTGRKVGPIDLRVEGQTAIVNREEIGTRRPPASDRGTRLGEGEDACRGRTAAEIPKLRS
jgi:hypothetical protein